MNEIFVFDVRPVQDHFPGIGRYAFRLANALAEFFPQSQFRLLHDSRARNTRFDFNALAARRNIECVEVAAKFFSLAEQQLAFQKKITANAAAFHSPYYALPLALPIPAVATLADVTPLILHAEMPRASKRLIYRVLNLAAARRAKHIITFSDASRADLERVLHTVRAKITTVPLAADENFAPASSQTTARARAELGLPEKYVLYVGSNKPHKNLPRLVEAWANVESDAALVIAGAWDVRYPQAQEIAARLDLGTRVLFRHEIAEQYLPALLSGAQIFVFPSVHEGFGLPPLEAMACGAPVACGSVSSLPEVVGDAALIFDPTQIQDIARVLSNAQDKNLRADLSERGLRRAKTFSWERVARETMQVYKKL